VYGRVEYLDLRFMSYFRCGHCVPTSWYATIPTGWWVVKIFPQLGDQLATKPSCGP
jgi:hypothetical protein